MTTLPTPVAALPAPRVGKDRPRAWLVSIVVVWMVALAAGIGWAVLRGGPTAREQTSVADAVAVVDQAVAQIAGAATADNQAVAAISGFDRVGECAISVLRSGERYQRTVTVVVTPGTEAALMKRVAARLPVEYQPKISTGSSPRVVADAGLWVRLSGSAVGKGQVRFAADTGDCRPLGDLTAALSAASASGSTSSDSASPGPLANRTEGAAVLARLGVAATAWRTYAAGCPGGGEISTVEAIGAKDAEPGALDEVLRGLGAPRVATPDVYAYANGPRQVAVRTDTDHLVVTSTTLCPA